MAKVLLSNLYTVNLGVVSWLRVRKEDLLLQVKPRIKRLKRNLHSGWLTHWVKLYQRIKKANKSMKFGVTMFLENDNYKKQRIFDILEIKFLS